jgi:hypothetical protein
MAVPKSSIQTFDSTGTMNDSARQVSAFSHQQSGRNAAVTELANIKKLGWKWSS